MQTPKLEKGKRREREGDRGGLDGKDSLSRDWCVCVLSGGRDNVHAGLCFGKEMPCSKYSRRVGVSLSVARTLIFWKMSKMCVSLWESLWERCLRLNGYEGFYQEALVGGLGQISGFS